MFRDLVFGLDMPVQTVSMKKSRVEFSRFRLALGIKGEIPWSVRLQERSNVARL